MNNEELILHMLAEMKNDMSNMKNDMTDMKNTINNIDDRTTRIELHLENVTDKNIMLLMEQHKPITDNLKEEEEKISTLLFDMDSLKRVVISHSKEINKLMNAK